VARRWGVSSITILRLIEQGDLKGLKIRGAYRISRGSIKDYESKVAF
jgi:excisionase family DNA binding protein